MSAWLTPLRATLDRTARPVTFFFRDDDAGWADQRLYRLVDMFDRRAVPLDLAAIPTALGDDLAAWLLVRRRLGPLGIHMHGYCHASHQTIGRKCEFGDARSPTEQWRDLDAGKRRLERLLGHVLDPIFTPPWNRCTQTTVDCLALMGMRALSRDATAAPLKLGRLQELSIAVDFLRRKGGVRLGFDDIARLLAEALGAGRPVGVMLHHAVMTNDDLLALEQLLDLLREHPAAQLEPMRALLAGAG